MCSINRPGRFLFTGGRRFHLGGIGVGTFVSREGKALWASADVELPPDIKRISLTASVRRTVEGNGSTGGREFYLEICDVN